MKIVYKRYKGLILVFMITILLTLIASSLVVFKLRTRPLQEIIDTSCKPACIYGIKPGETTVDAALDKLLSVSFPWQSEIVGIGLGAYPKDQVKSLNQGGTIRWGRDLRYEFIGEYSKVFDYAIFDKIDMSSPKIVRVHVTSDKTYAQSLKDYIDILGQPSHIWLYEAGPDLIAASLMYGDRGVEISLEPIPKLSSINLFVEDAKVQSFSSFVMNGDKPINRNFRLTDLLKWEGYRDVNFYCSQMRTSTQDFARDMCALVSE